MTKRTTPDPAKTTTSTRATPAAKGKTPKKPARVWDYIRKSGLQDKAKKS